MLLYCESLPSKFGTSSHSTIIFSKTFLWKYYYLLVMGLQTPCQLLRNPSYQVEHPTWIHVYSKKKISRHHRIFLSRVVFLWWRNRSDFSNSLKGKVWIVHCQIKSRWAATQHLTNEIQIAVWSCAMNLPSGIFLYESNYSIWTFSQAKISAGSCGFNGCWLLYKRLLLGHVLY